MADKLISILTEAPDRRKLIRAKVLEGLEESFPIKSRSKTLELKDLRVDEKDFSPTEQKMAILRGDTLFENVRGTVRMRDDSGKVIDEIKNFTVARVPWYTPRATVIVGGNEYSIANQVRPKPGVYSRKRANGVLETSFNTRGGANFSLTLDPVKGEPQMEYGTTKIPLYPVLRGAGVSHDRIKDAWGFQLADDNSKRLMPKQDKAVDKLYSKVVPTFHRKTGLGKEDQLQEVFLHYAHAQMDPEVNSRTIGKGYTAVTPDSILDASKKLLRVYKNADEVDDRDSLDFKALYAPDDFFKEVIRINARDVARKTSIKMEATPTLRKALPAGPFTPGLLRFINGSQLVSVPTAVNPVELIDASVRVTALGEGGIKSERAIPEEARHVHVTQINALDPFRTPESFRAGVDIRAAMMVKKDRNGNIFVPLRDVRNPKRLTYVRTGRLNDEIVAFPGQELRGTVDALQEGKIRRVPASKVRYQMPHPSLMYSPTTNLVPFIESLQGNRAVMGSKMQTQALSLIDREEPYVQVQAPDGKSFEQHMAYMINPRAHVAGTVSKIDNDYVYIKPDGEKTAARGEQFVKVPYEHYFPLAAKTHLHHEITVKPGDHVEKDQPLGESNFTRNNRLALGKNLSVAYMPYRGANSNDAVVISEGAAKKLTSERMYKYVLPIDPDMTMSRSKHQVYYGQNYEKSHYAPLDTDGVIQPGTKIRPGDPLALGLRASTMTADDMLLGKLHKSLARPYRESSQTWDHDYEGEVVDVVKTPKRIAITVKTREPMGIGDKLSGRYGNKGVVSEIVPDNQMVKDEKGRPIDVIMTSAGVVSRTNPAVIIETAVGKVVEKTGKPILVENLTGRDNVQWAKELLKKHRIKDKETVFDPVTGRKIPEVFVGRQYVMKLMKSTDTNYSARGLGNYDVNQQPTKGGTSSSKALGKMEFDALIGHNARNVLREAAVLKSQKNDEYWKALQLGYPTPPPKAAFASDKFLNMLTGAGVRVHREGTRMSLAPLTDNAVKEMSAGEIRDAKLVRAKDLRPETGGLFDPALTGGLSGTKWSHIDLAEPIVNPVFREPVRRLLGLTNPQLDALLKEKGGEYIKKELAKINLDSREQELLRGMKSKSASNLDNELKQVKYLRALKEQGLRPDEAYVVSKVPVLPPVFRPVLPGRGGQEIIYGDVNPLYRDLIYMNNQFKDVKKSKLLKNEAERLRPGLSAAVGAVYGVNDPVSAKSRARGHKGFLTYISGTNSPKTGYFHEKLLKRTQDVAGRGTIVPDSTLGMDEVGLPEDMMWTMYDKFIVKKLVQNGYRALEASQMVKNRHHAAREILLREAQERPVMINRAPTLHRYSMVGAYPKPVPGKTIRVNPFVEEGMNADYDGDTMMIHAPVGRKAVDEVKKMTLSNMLYSDKSRNDLLVFPQHEAIMGLAYASEQEDKVSPIKKFKNEGEAMKAYKAGKIGLGTRVQIGKLK
jgi:DNA-directed RNA polymerase subunit beta